MELAQDLTRQFRDRDELYKDIDASCLTDGSRYPRGVPQNRHRSQGSTGTPHCQHRHGRAQRQPHAVVFKPIGFGDVYQQNSTLA